MITGPMDLLIVSIFSRKVELNFYSYLFMKILSNMYCIKNLMKKSPTFFTIKTTRIIVERRWQSDEGAGLVNKLETQKVLFALGLGKTKLARLSFFETFEISLVLKKLIKKLLQVKFTIFLTVDKVSSWIVNCFSSILMSRFTITYMNKPRLTIKFEFVH